MADGQWCECALDSDRRVHKESCPVAPGQPFRVMGAELEEIWEEET